LGQSTNKLGISAGLAAPFDQHRQPIKDPLQAEVEFRVECPQPRSNHTIWFGVMGCGRSPGWLGWTIPLIAAEWWLDGSRARTASPATVAVS
jgi:hypothetical protein